MFGNNSYASKHQLISSATGKEAMYVRRQRVRMNFVSVAQCVFVPWIIFCIVYGVTSFHLHYSKPWACWVIVIVACLVTLGICTEAISAIRAKIRHDETKEPTWCIFLFITCVIAIVCGVSFGCQLFSNFMEPYYNYLNLNDYKNVNVQKMRGEQLMDAARMNFLDGTTLDLRKGMAFKNLHSYCVAPLTMATKEGVMAEFTNYDFWAVGLDCCSEDNSNFHCGEYNNPKALGGLRLLEEDERAFYRLAVQQAEAMYHIKASHPIFLYWTEDPVAEMESWREDGHKFFFIGMIVHLLWQMLVVGLGVSGFSKMGSWS